MQTIISTILLTLGLVAIAQAQTPESQRSIRFMLFSESDTSVGMSEVASARESVIPRIEFTTFDGGTPSAVDVPASGFQGPFKTTIVGNRLTIYRSGLVSLEGVGPADVLATVEVPPNWSELILYCFRSIERDAAQFLLLSEMSALRETQQTFCMNMTGKPIAVNVGEERFLLQPYERASVDLSDAGSADLVSIKVAAEWKENWRLALSTTRRLRKNDTHMLLFKAVPSNPRSMSLRVVRIPPLPTKTAEN